jgi:hypothetical protein
MTHGTRAVVNGYTKDTTLKDRYAATCQALLTCEDEDQWSALMDAAVSDAVAGAIRGDSAFQALERRSDSLQDQLLKSPAERCQHDRNECHQ